MLRLNFGLLSEQVLEWHKRIERLNDHTFLKTLSEDKVSQLLVFDPWIWTKLFNGQELVGLFVEICSDLLHQSRTLAITFTRYQLYVFRIDAHPVHFLFHTLCMPLVGSIYSYSMQVKKFSEGLFCTYSTSMSIDDIWYTLLFDTLFFKLKFAEEINQNCCNKKNDWSVINLIFN